MITDELTIDTIKRKIEVSRLLSDGGKKDWILWLPKMNPAQIAKLDKFLSSSFPESESEEKLYKVGSLTVTDLREAVSVYRFFERLNLDIRKLLATKQTTPGEIRKVFEACPLYKIYLDEGVKRMEGKGAEVLTQEEFEAITDFRASLKDFLGE